MKENVALYIPDLNKFYSKGKPTKAITTVDSYPEGLKPKDMIYLNDSILESYFIRGNSSSSIDKYLEIIGENWTNFWGLSYLGRNYYKQTSKEIDDIGYLANCVALSKGIKAVPFQTSKYESKDFKYEYDVHACLPAMLMFTYYLDDKESVHASHPLCENPLKDVHEVTFQEINSCQHIVPYIGQKNCKKQYLCSKINKNAENYRKVLQQAKMMIEDAHRKYKVDIHRIVYGTMLGSLLLSLPSVEHTRFLNVARSLMQLASTKLMRDELIEHSLSSWFDAVYLKSYDRKMETTCKDLRARYISYYKKIPGKRYLDHHRVKYHSLVFNSEDLYDSENYTQIYIPDHSVYEKRQDKNLRRGWCSFSAKELNIGRMFHIDIHNAYPNLYYKITGDTISKKEFGKLKCIDINLYQEIRQEVSERSIKILSEFDNTLLYWRTDGGIVLAKDDKFIKDLLIKNPDLLVEEIYETTPLYLDTTIKIPDKLKNSDLNKSRLFAYKVYTNTGDRIEFVNNFKEHRDEILKANDLLALKDYSSSVLSEILTHRRAL